MKGIMNLVNQIKGQIIYGAILSLIVLVFGANQVYAAGVSLSATPNTQTVTVGQTAIYTIKINRDGYTDKVTLSATGLPSNITASFTPNITTANSSTLKLQTSANTPIGTFKITVKGTANGITIAPITVKLTTIAAQAISISTFPQAQSIIAGQSTYYDVQINRTGFDGPVILSAENLPAGVSVFFEPQETTGNTSRMWLYSNGLPSFPQSFGMNVVARGRDFEFLYGLQAIKLNVNCDIVWTDQGYVEYNGVPDYATAITSDGAKNVYAAGYFVSNGRTDLWVAKYSSSGARIWLRNITLNNVAGLDKHARTIAVDTADNIYVAGSTLIAGAVNYEAFIVKFDGNGNQLRSQIFGTGQAEDGGAMELGFDTNGGAVLTSVMNVRRQNVNDGFGGTVTHAFYNVNRYTFDANLTITSGFSPLVLDVVGDPRDLAVGTGGEIYVVGSELNFNTVEYIGWAHKYGSGGGYIYNQPFSSDFIPLRVAADSNGNAFVAGNDYRTTGGNSSQDVWLAKLNATNGGRLWMTFDSTAESEKIGDLTTDASGNVIYAGTTTGNLAATNPDGNMDIWLAKRSGDGTPFFVRQFAVDNKDEVGAIALDIAGNALLAGNTVLFKGTNYGYEDVFLMKYSLSSSATLIRPFITRLTPSSVRGGTQFTIEGGNFFALTAIYFDGQPLNYTIVSLNRITVTAPTVTIAKTGNLTLSLDCYQSNSPTQLTVTP